METFGFIIKILIVGLVFAGLIAAIPYLVVKFTMPVWALPKTILEFLLYGAMLSAIFANAGQPIIGLIIALIISVFRYKSRVAKYQKIAALAEDGVKG